MIIEKVYFPPPPPTFNTLTSVERAHLRRSTNKLGRVLGITPQVIDSESDTTIDDDVYNHKGHVSPFASTTTESRYRWSTRAGIVASSTMRHPLSSLSCVDFHEDEPDLSNNAHRMASMEPKRRLDSTSTHHPPLLRVSRSSHFYSEPTVNLPPYSSHVSPASDGSEEEDSIPDLYSDTSSNSDTSEPPSPTIPPPSINALRRKKIERLQRILGEDVPVDLIFPDKRSDEGSSDSDGERHEAFGAGPSSAIMRRPKTAPADGFRFKIAPFGEHHLRRPATTTGASASPSLTEKRPQEFSFQTASLPSSPQTRQKRPSTPHPHYRLQSSFREANPTQPVAPAKYSYIYYPNQLSSSNEHLPLNEGGGPEYGDAKSLQTIVESPDEIESILASRASSVFLEQEIRKTSSRTRSSDMSFSPEWHLGDLDRDGPAVSEAISPPDGKSKGDRKEETRPNETRRIRRKPPPVYEPS
ncbi:hypothetical protein F5887DRAFT_1086354 [Amanita rubescens]|nr:hypothetical protein F5887DRAFT_1086354 [Amanita rubescens]